MLKIESPKDYKDNSKGQKIAAALYLVTRHLSESDPLRLELRSLGVDLVSASHDEKETIGEEIKNLLEVGVLAMVLSEKNARIIEAELKYYIKAISQEEESLSMLFSPDQSNKGQYLPRPVPIKDMSFINTKGHLSTNKGQNKSVDEKRTKRKSDILSFINRRKSSNVKDIALLFPGVSEKTIQRELGALVQEGKVRRVGDRRWSIYLPVEIPGSSL
ncbi:MAG TPA: hypothetical protein VG982_03040 [Candidatus Paceibacterota bacterium]|nr:hypothetical protein [Candidatus Paceibacterota bacterium]